MQTLLRTLGYCLLAALTTTAFAQSSGNASWSVDQTQCSISCPNNDCIANQATGFNTTGVAKLSTTIQTPTSGSTAIIIRPSAVTGLFTNTKTTSSTIASAEASVNVTVKLDGNPIPGLSSVVYEQRLQQLSTNIFQNLYNTSCTTDPNTGVTTCTCSDGQTCNIDLALATLSAHSYDFVVQNPNANGTNNHTVEVDFALSTPNSGSGSSAAACVGPVTLTVEQVKAFQQNFN